MPQKYSKSLCPEVKYFGNVTLLKKEMEIKVVNQMVRSHQDGAKDSSRLMKYRMSHDSVETSSEEDSGENEDYLATGKDEVDNVCFPRHLNIPQRSRHMSLSESEDSFIVFGNGSEDEDSDFSEDSSDGEEEDQEGEDLNEDMSKAEIMVVENVDEKAACCKSNTSVKSAKKVSFAEDDQLCNVQSMVKWAYAYQAARKGPWEAYARDRDRFKRRIAEASRIIDTVLQATHRRHIFNDRFVRFEVPLKI